MKHNLMKRYSWWFLTIILFLSACAPTAATGETAVPPAADSVANEAGEPATPTLAPTSSPTPESPLGTVSLAENKVLHGQAENDLVPLLESAAFFAEDVIQVIEGGEAVLDFGDQMRLHLFNDSELELVAAETGADVPLGVQLFLFVGGFTGALTEEGGRAVFRTPGDVEITVLGTEFFVVYDEENQETVVGNFGGRVELASAGEAVSLAENTYVVVPDGALPGPALPLTLTREAFETQARRTDSPLQAISEARVWTMEIRHEFVHDYAEQWTWADGPPTYLRLWTGQFTIEGATIVGSGTGLVQDVNLKCNNFANPANVRQIAFALEGSFDFDIGGEVISGENGQTTFLLDITATDLRLNSLDEIIAIDGNCDWFAQFFLDNNLTIIEDLPLVDAEAIRIEAAPVAREAYQLDPEPYDKYQPDEGLGYTYDSIYFRYPLTVSIQAGP